MISYSLLNMCTIVHVYTHYTYCIVIRVCHIITATKSDWLMIIIMSKQLFSKYYYPSEQHL